MDMTSNGVGKFTPELIDRLAGFKELADYLNVDRGTVTAWYGRRDSPLVPTRFPDELARNAQGRLFDVREVLIWWIKWPNPRRAAGNRPKVGHIDRATLQRFRIDLNELLPLDDDTLKNLGIEPSNSKGA
jgi:hypothetical protein